jgi:dTDP-4-dehydrorhamnose reductase
MRILVTGASGMLGASLAVELSRKHKVFGTGNSEMILPIDYKIFDLLKESYKELIEWSKPELIIHCAALTNGNFCQNNPLDAFNLNGCTTKKLMDASDDHVKIIYISTDAVFSSSLHMAKEVDCISPENIYGKSKELGEFFLVNSNRDYLILRTTIVGLNYYREKNGFVEWILNSVKAKETIMLFDDVLFTPISIWDFIIEINFLINQNTYNSKIFHITGGEVVTKYEFGMSLIQELSLDTSCIKKGYISKFTDRAKRSNDQTLDCSLYKQQFKRKLPNLKDTIITIKNNI